MATEHRHRWTRIIASITADDVIATAELTRLIHREGHDVPSERMDDIDWCDCGALRVWMWKTPNSHVSRTILPRK